MLRTVLGPCYFLPNAPVSALIGTFLLNLQHGQDMLPLPGLTILSLQQIFDVDAI